ncbi:MAG TPA: MotA/TolQ/ExbB proton channel family protein [Bdellovibrionales bacterium]|jgi:biopolymer transport protein ExbB|nr:MotA/TolQ/ExbB proton channel family protein [Bdellovibrionales bacterium]
MLVDKLFNIAQGGAEAILWLLLIVSVISIGIILERFWTLRQVANRSNRAKDRMREALQSNNLDELEEISKDRDSLEGRALSYGLRHIKESGVNGLPEIFNSFALLERPFLDRSLNFLATVGSNAPFVGLLGTVLGIMKAFRDLAQNASASGNEAVMLGIAEALVATAVGLLVAIPAVIAYNAFSRQVRSSLQSLETVRELCVAYAKKKGRA